MLFKSCRLNYLPLPKWTNESQPSPVTDFASHIHKFGDFSSPLQTKRTTQGQLTDSAIAQLAQIAQPAEALSVLPPPHHVNSAPPELVNQLPSAVVFIAATINSTSSTGDPGSWANSARCQARQLVGWSSSSTGRLFLEPPRQEGAFGPSSSQHSSWQTWKPEQRNEEEQEES